GTERRVAWALAGAVHAARPAGAGVAAGGAVLVRAQGAADSAAAARALRTASDFVRILRGAEILRVAPALLAGIVAVGPLRPGQGVTVVGALGGPGGRVTPGPLPPHRGQQSTHQAARSSPEYLSPRHALGQISGQLVEVVSVAHGRPLSLTTVTGPRPCSGRHSVRCL